MIHKLIWDEGSLWFLFVEWIYSVFYLVSLEIMFIDIVLQIEKLKLSFILDL